jgi:hypothetical protein
MAKRAKIWNVGEEDAAGGDVEVVFGPMDVGYKPEPHAITHDHADKLLATITLPHRRAYAAFILATGTRRAGEGDGRFDRDAKSRSSSRQG